MNKHWAVMLISAATLLAVPLVHAQEVARTIITTNVVDREPVNDLQTIPSSTDTVIFFTDLRDMQGQTVTHRWMFGNEQMAEVNFDVRGPRWRVWSSKNMLPEWTGGWSVQVVNGVGEVVAEKSFTYGMAEDAGMETATEQPMEEALPMTEEAPVAAPQEMEPPTAVEEQGGMDTAE